MVRFTKNDGSFILCGKDEDPKSVLMGTLMYHPERNHKLLTFADAAKIPDMIQPNTYAYYYGCSFNEVAELAWSRVTSE